jgi:hypothetical protein
LLVAILNTFAKLILFVPSTEGCGSATAAEGLIENPIDNYRTPAQQCYQPHDLARLNVCTCGKPANKHANADHEFERDDSLPQWHGWHPFRRGLGTNLHDLGVHIKTPGF